MATTFLNGKYVIERDSKAGFVLKRKVQYELKDKKTGLIHHKEKYLNTYYGNYKSAMIGIINDAPEDAKDIKEVLEIINRIEQRIINSDKI